jgi:nucleoside-diphosphate-sugar epimerase
MQHVALITGANGFIGRRLVEVLAAKGWAGIAVSRSGQQKVPANWRTISRRNFLAEAIHPNPSCIIHLESLHHVLNPTLSDLANLERVNIGGTSEILEKASCMSCSRFIYFSSIKAVRPSSGPTNELADGPGNTPYGRSKWEAEIAVNNWTNATKERSSLILRPAVVYGPENMANIYAMLDAVARGRFPLINGGRNIKSIVSRENVCGAVAFLMERMKPGVSVFNLVDAQSYPVERLARMMAGALGVRAPEFSIPLPIARSLASIGDMLKSIGISGFPINTTRLNGLIEESHFSADLLISAGFKHIETTQSGIDQLARWYLNKNQGIN